MEEIAHTFAKAGAAIAIADLNLDGANAVAQGSTTTGGKALGVMMDVTNEDTVNKGINLVAAAFRTIDILVSNAGIQVVNPIENYSFLDRKKKQAIYVDGEFTTVEDVAQTMLFLSSFPSAALTGQSFVVSHG